MRILLVDNYDSFTWNIEHILVSAGALVDVVRNDAINPHAVVQFDGLVLSPGPGVPDEAGQLMRIIPIAAAHSVPTLGWEAELWETRIPGRRILENGFWKGFPGRQLPGT